MSTGSGDSSYLRCSSCGRVHQVSKSDSSKERVAQMSCVQCGSTSLVAASWEDAPVQGPGDEGTVIRMKPAGQPSGIAAPGMIGQSLAGGKYVILKLVGEGGGGVVFRAKQPSLKRDVAIKLLKAEGMDQSQTSRFLREARLAIRLRHPHIIETYDLFEEEGRQYLVMEYVDGTTLTSWWTSTVGGREGGLAGHRKDPATLQFLKLIIDTCDGLHYAHEEGVIHRDMKPPNVMVTKSGVGKLADFGLAREVSSQSVLTLSGTILGTPNYMSPEQAKGLRQIDRRTDVYGMGAILYWGLTGQPPFEGEGIFETLQMIIDEEAKAPTTRNPSIDRALENVMLKCLEKEPDRRYGTSKELREELERYVKAGKVEARAPGALRKAAGQVKRKRSLQIGLAVTATVLIVGAVAWRLIMGAQEQGARDAQIREWRTVADAAATEVEGTTGEARLDLLNRRLEGDPDNPYLLVERGLALRSLGRFEEARTDLSRAAEVGQDLPRVLYEAARLEEMGAALQVWTDSRADGLYAAAALLNAQDAHVQLGLARIRIRESRDTEALEHVEAALAASPNLLDALLLEVEVLNRTSGATSAAEALERAKAVDSSRAEVWSFEGVFRIQEGNFDGAREALERAVQEAPEDPYHLWNLAFLYSPEVMNRPLLLRQTLDELATLDPEGFLGRRAREMADAMGQTALQLTPSPDLDALRMRMLHNRAGAEAEMRTRMDQAITSGDIGRMLENSVDALSLQMFETARIGLDAVVESAESNPYVHWALARIYLRDARESTVLEDRRPLLRQAFDHQKRWQELGGPTIEPDPFPVEPEWRLIELQN